MCAVIANSREAERKESGADPQYRRNLHEAGQSVPMMLRGGGPQRLQRPHAPNPTDDIEVTRDPVPPKVALSEMLIELKRCTDQHTHAKYDVAEDGCLPNRGFGPAWAMPVQRRKHRNKRPSPQWSHKDPCRKSNEHPANGTQHATIRHEVAKRM